MGRGFPCYSSSPHSRFDNNTYTKVNAETAFSQKKRSPVGAYFTKFSSAFPSRPNRARTPNDGCVEEMARNALCTSTKKLRL